MKIGFLEALTLLFIAVKLTGHVSWSWWVVFAPLAVVAALRAMRFMVGEITGSNASERLRRAAREVGRNR